MAQPADDVQLLLSRWQGCGSGHEGWRAVQNGAMGHGSRGDRGPEAAAQPGHGYVGSRVGMPLCVQSVPLACEVHPDPFRELLFYPQRVVCGLSPTVVLP